MDTRIPSVPSYTSRNWTRYSNQYQYCNGMGTGCYERPRPGIKEDKFLCRHKLTVSTCRPVITSTLNLLQRTCTLLHHVSQFRGAKQTQTGIVVIIFCVVWRGGLTRFHFLFFTTATAATATTARLPRTVLPEQFSLPLGRHVYLQSNTPVRHAH